MINSFCSSTARSLGYGSLVVRQRSVFDRRIFIFHFRTSTDMDRTESLEFAHFLLLGAKQGYMTIIYKSLRGMA